MSWNQSDRYQTGINRLTLAAAVAMAFAIAVLGVGIYYWWEFPRNSGVSVLMTSIGASGTLILASATIISVRQSTRSVSELEKEREKPVVQDEIVKVLQPAIQALTANLEGMESETGVDWVYSQPFGYNPHGSKDRASSVFADPAPVAMVRLQQTRPELWSQLEDHENLYEQLIQLADEICNKMETPIRMCFDELGWEIPESEDEVNVKLLVSAAVKGLDEFGESSPYYMFWQQHGEELNELVRSLASEEMQQLESTEERWKRLCETLSDELLEHKIELQQEYGISESTIDDELEEWPAVV